MTPGAPAPPSGQAGPPPLAPSPLLDNGNNGSAADEANDQNPEALTKFRPYLDPYGTWIDDPTYGRVWIPNARSSDPISNLTSATAAGRSTNPTNGFG